MKKRLAIIGLLLVFTLGGVGVVIYTLQPTPGVTFRNFNRLRLGMTEEEVEAILGQKGEEKSIEMPYAPTIWWHGTVWENGDRILKITFDKINVTNPVVDTCTWNTPTAIYVLSESGIVHINWGDKGILATIRGWLGFDY